jgi:ArsR family transcriptional regulator
VSRHEGNSVSETGFADEVARALASNKRLAILRWLREPAAHFPPMPEGGAAEEGICSRCIAQKLGVTQPTAEEHLRLLTDAGLLRPRRIDEVTFYSRDEERIAGVERLLRNE